MLDLSILPSLAAAMWLEEDQIELLDTHLWNATSDEDHTSVRGANADLLRLTRKVASKVRTSRHPRATGKGKPSFTKTHKLLISPTGTLSAKILDICPVSTCSKDLARYTTKEHVPGCVETAVQEHLAGKYAALLVVRGCPVFGCKSKWNVRGGKEKDAAKSWKDHVRQQHKDGYTFCGLVKADGTECQWSPRSESSSHHESLVALLEAHREHAHAHPARPTVSCSFDKEHWVCLVGQVELQRYWAAKCPNEGDTLVSTKARWNGQEHCPICLLDHHLAPSKRMETSKAAAQHLFRSHLFLDKYESEHAFIRCPCLADVIPLWTFFEHLDAAGAHVLSDKDKTVKDPCERPRALSRGPLPPACYHRPHFSSANQGVYHSLFDQLRYFFYLLCVITGGGLHHSTRETAASASKRFGMPVEEDEHNVRRSSTAPSRRG